MRALAFLLLPWIACCAGPSSLRGSGRGEVCEAAVAYAQHVLQRAAYYKYSVVFSIEDVDQRFTSDPVEWHREQLDPSSSRIPGPPQSMQRSLASRGGLSAVRECSSVRVLLQERRIGFGPDAVAVATGLRPADLPTGLDGAGDRTREHRAKVERFTLPEISNDGRLAVLSAETASNPALSSGMLFYLRREGRGPWRVYGSALVWSAE